MPTHLTTEQVQDYDSSGFLVLEKQIPDSVISDIRREIDRFGDIARGMVASDDKIDLEDSHTPDSPRIRRVKLPHTQSTVIDDLMRSDVILGPVRDLIGPNIRLQTTKLNMKSAGFGAAVEWHQDWAFYPYTNDDVLAVGIMIDDMTEENGPLRVFPGSHTGEVYSHHHNGYFVGAMDLQKCGLRGEDSVPLMGPAGSISIHHARIVHGSDMNASKRDRRVIFYEMMAADAFPIVGGRGSWTSLEEFDSRMLCGATTLEPRVTPCPMRVASPDAPTQGSIYEVQKAMGRRAFATLDEG